MSTSTPSVRGTARRSSRMVAAKTPAPPSARSSRQTLVTTTCSRPMTADGLRDAARLVVVVPVGPAGLDGAEAAGPGAGVAQDHDGGRALLPALADVRAAGLLADGVERLVAHEVLELRVVGAAGQPGLDPVGMAARVRPVQPGGIHGAAHGDGQGLEGVAAAVAAGGPGGWKMGSSRATVLPDGGLLVDRLRASRPRRPGSAPAWAPSVARWSMAMHMFIIERTAMASPCSSRTTGRLTIFSMVTMATSGTLMMGSVRIEPVQPVLSTVNVPPCEVLRAQPLAAGAGGQVVDGHVERRGG